MDGSSASGGFDVLIATSQRLLLYGAIKAVTETSRARCAGESTTFQGLLEYLQQNHVDLVVLDAELEQMNGPAGLHELHMFAPDVKLLVVAASDDPNDVCRWLGGGARGYVPVASTEEQYQCAVHTVISGGLYAPVSLCRQVKDLYRVSLSGHRGGLASSLTRRQAEVLELVLLGYGTTTIARQLDLAVATVRIHLLAIYRAMADQTQRRADEHRQVLPRLMSLPRRPFRISASA